MAVLNWSNLRHAIGDLQEDAEYCPVVIRTPDGGEWRDVEFTTDGGEPCLVVRPIEEH